MEPLILDPAINKKVQCQQRINEMRERERARNEVAAAMKEISSDCHLNEKRRPLKVADNRRKTRTRQSRKKRERAQSSAQIKPKISRKRRERKSAGSLKE